MVREFFKKVVNMPTICYLMAGLGYTGGNIVLYSFMDQLSLRGWDVYAVTPNEVIRWKKNYSDEVLQKAYAKKSKSSLLRKIGKSVIPKNVLEKLRMRYKENIISDAKNISSNCPNCDIVVATYWTTAYAANMLSQYYPAAYHMQHYEEVFAVDDDYLRSLIRITYGFPLYQIANSRWLSNLIYKLWLKKVPVVNPAINHNIFKASIDEVKGKYNNSGKIRIVSYADDRPFKAWVDIKKSMEIVFDTLGRNKVEWLAFGGGNAPSGNLPLKHLGKLHPVKLAELYRSAHIVIMPSWYESFPLPPIEAMACGTAVVCSEYGTEDYAINDKNAKVVKPRNINAIADTIIELSNNKQLSRELALEGLNKARNFTWEQATDRLEDVLQYAMDSGRKRCQSLNQIKEFSIGSMNAYHQFKSYY